MFLAGCEEKTAAQKTTTEKIAESQQQTEQTQEQIEAEAIEEQSQGEPRLVLEQETLDFGNIDPGSRNKAEFTFKNGGNGVLKINKVKSTCGCTVPQLKKKSYLPGESGKINVTYTANQRSGPVKKALHILSNDPGNSNIPFYIKADIVKKISYKPDKLKLRLDKENAGAEEIKIESLDGKKFSISKIAVRPECMKFDFDPAAEDLSFTLTPTINEEKIKTVNSGRITFFLNHPSQKNVAVGFDVLPPYKSDPATLIALNAAPKQPVRKILYILSNYGEDFDIESIEPTNDIIRVVNQEKMKDKYVVTLDIVAPESTKSKRHFNSKLNVKIAGGDTLTISCVGSIKKNS
jgi:hypothetical protein